MLTLRTLLLRTIEKNKLKDLNSFHEPKIVQIENDLRHSYSRSEISPAPEDIEQLQKSFMAAINNNEWQNITNKKWKKACWILWRGNQPIIENKVFLDKYLDYCKSNVSARLTKSIMYIYFMDYKENLSCKKEIVSFICEQLNSERFKITLAIWRERNQLYHLFATHTDFKTLANNYFSFKGDAFEYLTNLGLDGNLENSNFAQSLLYAIANLVKDTIAKDPKPMMVFKKFKDIAIKNNILRFTQRTMVIESLLCPWSNKAPHQELCKTILTFLLEHFNDPRVSSGQRNWISVSEDAKKVIRKWLAGATLEQFFNIIDSTAQDEHWRYRRSFWKAYYDADHIDEAWIVLGKESHREALAQADENQELIGGHIKGSGVKSDHSVLIFQLGELIICEWSHVGKCRIWLEENKKSPQLYKNQYLAEELRKHEDFNISHQQSVNYTWQKKLAEYVENHTGIRMPRYKYEIRK